MNNNKLLSKINIGHKPAFTIIEVIIVLVIGAVIMLAVFLVVPQLQRTQRNSRAQNDARRILTAAEQYAANNNGNYPTCAAGLNLDAGATGSCTDITNITGAIKTPTNTSYATVTPASAALPASGQIAILNTGTCSASGSSGQPTYTGTTNGFIVVVSQEPTGSFCLQKQ